MTRDLDAELLESVRVRRRRLRDAFLHGALRTRRMTADNVRRLVISAILAAIACAVCAGVSFVKAHIHDSDTMPVVGVVRTTAPAGMTV